MYQVSITVADGKVTNVAMVQNGLSDEESMQIKSKAIPTLISQVLSSQSPKVSYVSGASYTSQGFASSVSSAFTKAGL
ncbi:FMN-binding protein [Demequina zhanjiangensis]|uniref:FMN-binding protein n=1 Tax=Demequina zhanjiangensis TaxID=3051659 RepID=A0ABT8G348_9MICO|nr:FMN-binding protein [Demequina sp. SYSU T00b26]MDN4473550.1 FMN-binding protein [Demequina sp. SYSU T00b26]